jgi:hypothetical protein
MDGQYLPDDELDIDSLASSEPPEYVPQMFSEGGEVEEEDIQYYAKGGDASIESQTEAMNQFLLADEADTAYAPMYPSESDAPERKTAKLMLKQLSTKSGGGGKSKRSKEMSMPMGDLSPAIPELGAPQTEQEKLMQIASARSQYDALEKAYKLKAQAAQRAGKGLMKPTFNTVMFDQPTLEKPGPLMARTFQFGGLVSKALKSGAKKGASSADNLVPSSARSLFPEQEPSLFPSIIKEEGGNWMIGNKSPEEFVRPLYRADNLTNPGDAKSLNKWIDKKLTPYIKNKMATPSDPVRKLAEEEGILPFPDTPVNAEVTSNANRIAAGLPIEQQAPISKTDRGQAWENRADAAINVGPYQDMVPFGYSNDLNETLRDFGGEFAVQNPTAKVSGMNTGRGPEDLGFNHIVDVLQENLTTGRLSPDSLRGLSMEDAVRLTHQYDLDMADKMKKAQIQSLEGVPVYKQYPEQGFRWMQLDKPGYFAAESDAMGHSVRGYEPPVGHADWTPQSGNKGSPGYGYGGWEAIKSGDVKVYSLADDQGKRYTTVEAVKEKHPLDYVTYGLESRARGENYSFPAELLQDGSIPEEKLQEIYALGKKMYFENPNAFAENRLLSGAPAPSPMDSFQKAADQVVGELPPSINQIKGQVNGYIAEDAQPFVQDFLNSGNWSTVNDLHLAGLRDIKEVPKVERYIKDNNLDNRRFLTEDEYNKYEKYYLGDTLKRQLGGFDPLAPVQPAGMAKGGEADKEDLPGLYGVSDYARQESANMFPEEDGQYDRQDSARHMLAAATLARKYGPGTAELAGQMHELKTSPIRFIGSKMGMMKESPDYTQDIHNNRLGIELASKSKSQEELLALVRQMALQAREGISPGKASTGKPAGMSDKVGRYGSQGPVKRADGSPPDGERLTPQQIERLASDQAELNRYQPVMNTNIQRQGAKSRKLATERDINQLPDPQTYAFIQSALLGTPPDEVANQFSVFHPKRKEILGRAEQGFVAGNVALVGPAARMLKEVTAPAVKYLGKEAARQVERGIFNEGPLRGFTPQPAFAVRPEGGGTTFTGVQSTGKSNAPISKLDKMIDAGANPSISGLSNEMGDAIENFWRSKAQNYYTRQYGTPSDPIFNQIISGQLRTPALQKQIPDYAIEQTRAGKTRVDPVTGESRFYPKYPQALEDLTRRYDEMTGLKGLAFNTKEPLFDPAYPSTMGDRGRQLESQLAEDVTEKMVAGGMDPNLINPKISLTGPRGGEASNDLLNYIPNEYKELYNLYKRPPEESNMIDRIYKELGIGETKVPGVVPENIKRAIQTSEPIYDIDMPYKSALEDLLSPKNINQYLATLSPKEITKMRFEDVVKNSARYNLDMFNTQNLVNAVKGGKRIPEKTWKQGLSEPLMNFEKDGQNFTWHRILDNEATAIEGAYIGHSVGGYAKGGAYGPKEYRRFKEGEEVQVYTLRDSKGKPFTTVQVEKAYTGPLGRVLSESDIVRAKAEGRELGPMSTIVKQIKGNGAKTGNVAPKDADEGVLSFLKTYIKPDKIAESDSYLTPKLEEFKMDLSGRPRP